MLSEALGTWASIMLIYISRALLNHTAGSLQIFWQEVLAALFTSASKKKRKEKTKSLRTIPCGRRVFFFRSKRINTEFIVHMRRHQTCLAAYCGQALDESDENKMKKNKTPVYPGARFKKNQQQGKQKREKMKHWRTLEPHQKNKGAFHVYGRHCTGRTIYTATFLRPPGHIKVGVLTQWTLECHGSSCYRRCLSSSQLEAWRLGLAVSV